MKTSDALGRRVAKLLKAVESHLGSDNFKPTVADFIKLLQLHKEFEKQKPRIIEVRWVDTPVNQQIDAA